MTTKKIFSFVGSPKGKESNTYKLVSKVLENVKIKATSNVEYEIVTSRDLNLRHCSGCQKCFNKGTCHLDYIDGFNKTKEKLEEADMIILGSPVYACAVTADMKVFIDRISYWLHLLKLAGKPGVSFVTASSNSISEVNSYLKKIMQILGMELICNISCFVDVPNMLQDTSFIEETIPSYVDLMIEYIDGKKVVKTTEFHDKFFQFLRYTYSNANESTHAEVIHWRKSGYLNFEDYEQLLNHIHSSKDNKKG